MITGRNEVVAKVIFLHLSVILFTGWEGVCLSACWDTPRIRHHPPGSDSTPPDQADTTTPRTRHHHPPDQADPPRTRHHPPPRPGRHPPTPPQTRQTPGSRLQHTVYERRYASYWNAFLFKQFPATLQILRLRLPLQPYFLNVSDYCRHFAFTILVVKTLTSQILTFLNDLENFLHGKHNWYTTYCILV